MLIGVLSTEDERQFQTKTLRPLRQFYLMGEQVKRSKEWLIKRLTKVAAKVAYHGRRPQVHVASAFPLAKYHRSVFG
jgi:hypothetical protein